MLIVDTNVISEIMQLQPSPRVLGWWGQQPASELFTSAVTVAEILYGIELLPRGKRQERLFTEAEAMFTQDFAGRILSFDEAAAGECAQIAARRRALGRPIAEFDAQIAAIASAHRATLATRNLADFDGCGVRLVNPWRD
jgi:toxin FitB